MRRLLAALAAATAVTLLAAPATLAGKAEDAFLTRLIGAWSGGGALTGAETGRVECAMTIRQRTDGVNFRVQCDAGEFGPQNFSGVLGYNDAEGRYEARSAGGEVTPGVKSGSSVVFTSRMKGIATGTSVMKVSASRIIVDTSVSRSPSSGEIKSHIELKK